MLKSYIAIAAALCLALLVGACTKTLEEQLSPKDWELSTDASSTYYYLLLEDAKRQNNSTIGEFALEGLLQTDASPQIFVEAANFYWHQGDAERTKQVLQQGLARYPESQELELMLAQLYLAEKQLDDAAATINSYLEKNPDDMLTRQELADILIRNEQYQKALDVLGDIPKDEQGPIILYYLAKAHEGLGKRNLAIKLLKQAVASDSGIIEAWAELAYLYELEQDYGKALATYTHMLEMGESSQELWLRLVDLNLKMGRPDQALALVRKGPADLSFALGAGTLFVDQNYYKQAEQVFLPLTKDNPEAKEVNFYLALLAYRGDKNLDKAISLLEKVPHDNRFYSRALRFRAHLLWERGTSEDKAEALQLAREGRAMFQDDEEFWILEASLLEDQENLSDALNVLEVALKKWPDEPELLFLFGVLLDKTDQKDEALAVMERIVTISPDHADALNYLGYTLADRNQQLDRAYTLLTKAKRLKPDNGYIQDSMAWVLYRMGRLPEAWEEIQQAVKLADSDPIIWEHYGDIAASLGNIQEARTGYEKSLTLNPEDPEAVRRKLEAL